MLRLFGEAHVEIEGRRLTGLPAKAFVLFALLILEFRGVAAREQLRPLLWEDAPGSKTSANLRWLLAAIGKWQEREGIELIEVSATHVALAPGAAASDLGVLLALDTVTDVAGLDALLDAYRGELLVGVDRDLGTQLLAQVVQHRASLGRKFLALGRGAAERIGGLRGEDLLRQLLARAPDDEALFRALVRVLDHQGSRGIIAAEYQAFRDRLERDFDAEPSLETDALVAQLVPARGRATPAGPASLGTPGAALGGRHGGVPPLVPPPPPTPPPGPPPRAGPCHAPVLGPGPPPVPVAALPAFPASPAPHHPPPVPRARSGAVRGGLCREHDPAAGRRRAAARHCPDADRHPAGAVRRTVRVRRDRSRRALRRHVPRHCPAGRRRRRGGGDRRLSQHRGGFGLCAVPARHAAYAAPRPQIDAAGAAAFSRAIELSPDYVPAVTGLARSLTKESLALRRNNDRDLVNRALVLAEKAIDMDPLDPNAWRERAHAHLYLNDLDASLEFIEAARGRARHHADILAEKADILIHASRAADAKASIEQALALNPAAPDDYLWILGASEFFIGRYGHGLETLLKIRRKDDVSRLIAATAAMAGDMETAAIYRRQFLELYPDARIEQFTQFMPYKSKSDVDHYVDALRRAGFP